MIFHYEKFIDNSLSYKITARNIRWVSEDSLYRLQTIILKELSRMTVS